MICIDFETRSEIDIKKSGSWVYSLHPTTDILCMAYKINNMPVQLGNDMSTCYELKDYLFDNPGSLIEAHNAFFEKSIWQNIMVKRYGWPEIKPEQWRCSASVASYHALPRSLGEAGKVLDLTTVKDEQGKRVMLQLAKPKKKGTGFYEQKDELEKFLTLYDYCRSDVEAEYAISERLGRLPERELKIWQLDQKINMRGVPIDMDAVRKALNILDGYTTKLTEELQDLTEGCINTVGQRDKILSWCKERGEDIPGLTKTDVEGALGKVKNPKVKKLLELRQALGKTSIAKYQSMNSSCGPDNRIRDTLMYHGASTGRWSGKLVQFQNLPRGSIKDMDTALDLIKLNSLDKIELIEDNVMSFMSSAIRGMVCAPKGKHLLVADFAAIEARVLGWLAGSQKMLKQFRNGEDLYKDMASIIYGVDVKEVTSAQRQLGKAAILGCGYGMGVDKFLATCCSWGIELDINLAQKAVTAYREQYIDVVRLWRDQQNAALTCVRNNKTVVSGKFKWYMENDFLVCELPSTRKLSYYKPKSKEVEKPWGFTDELTYSASKMGKVFRNATYGGKLVENLTQAVARDIMADAMLRIEDKGYRIIMTIHDELVAEEKEGSTNTIEKFCGLMKQSPNWAIDCPIDVEGWCGKRYKK